MKAEIIDWAKFFTNEAISNYVVFVFGIVIGVVGWWITRYLSRKKPQFIDIIKAVEISVIAIDSDIKQDISIQYKGKGIKSLYRTTYHIINRSDSIIDDVWINIYIRHQNQNNILHLGVSDHLESLMKNSAVSFTQESTLPDVQEIGVKLDFINPYSTSSERRFVDVFSLEPFQTLDVRGRGRGWSVRYFNQIQYRNDLAVTIDLFRSESPISRVTGFFRLLDIIAEISMPKKLK